jgi:N-acetylglucosaminyldiphosphoundecaprenol N-acetyl-beta-D-mannosaminyltransferase
MIAQIAQARHAHERILLLHHNLHSLYLYETSPALRAAYSPATSVYIDGILVVWLARLAGLRIDRNHRITLLDSFEFMIDAAVKNGWRVFYLGSADAVLQQGLTNLKASHPELVLAGHHGFFAKDEQRSREVIEQINSFRPDILFGLPSISPSWR